MDIFGACLLGKIQFKVCAGMEKNWEIFDSDQLNQFQHRLVTLKYLKHTKPNMFSRLIKYSCSERNEPFVFERFYCKKKHRHHVLVTVGYVESVIHYSVKSRKGQRKTDDQAVSTKQRVM